MAKARTALGACGEKEVATEGGARGATASTTSAEATLPPSGAPAGTATLPRTRMCAVGLPHPKTSPEAPRSGRHSAVSVVAAGGAPAPPPHAGAHASPPVCSAAKGGKGAQGLGSASSSPCRPVALMPPPPPPPPKNRPLSAPLKKG